MSKLLRKEPSPVEQTDDERLVEEGRTGVPVALGLAVQRQRAAELEENEDDDDDSGSGHFLVLFRKLSDSPLQDDDCVIELIAR